MQRAHPLISQARFEIPPKFAAQTHLLISLPTYLRNLCERGTMLVQEQHQEGAHPQFEFSTSLPLTLVTRLVFVYLIAHSLILALREKDQPGVVVEGWQFLLIGWGFLYICVKLASWCVEALEIADWPLRLTVNRLSADEAEQAIENGPLLVHQLIGDVTEESRDFVEGRIPEGKLVKAQIAGGVAEAKSDGDSDTSNGSTASMISVAEDDLVLPTAAVCSNRKRRRTSKAQPKAKKNDEDKGQQPLVFGRGRQLRSRII